MIQPSAADAAREHAVVARLVRNLLEADEADVSYPGFVAAAFAVQVARRAGGGRDDVAPARRAVTEQARLSAGRADGGPCPAWRVDLPPPEPHLEESLDRAKRQVPKRPERAEALAKVRIAGWQDNDRDAFCRSSCLLSQVWPEMLAEMTVVVRQVALMDGFGIDGFTDFTTHGVVFVNRERLRANDDGLPGDVRFSEALVHEATHNRCNVAAVSHPFLVGDSGDDASLVMTPLRADPRPLTGLFQQLVVLVRSVLLYDRLLDGDPGPVRDRREVLVAQAGQALHTARTHLDRFTPGGRAAIDECAELLERAGVSRAAR